MDEKQRQALDALLAAISEVETILARGQRGYSVTREANSAMDRAYGIFRRTYS